MHRKVLRMAPHLLVNKIKYKRAIDILITHAPPLGINDEKDLAHLGFKEFLAFMKNIVLSISFMVILTAMVEREKNQLISRYMCY